MENAPHWQALPFESEVLGVPSARVSSETPFSVLTLPALMDDLRGNGMQFVSCRIADNQSDCATALERQGFVRIDIHLSYRRAIEPVGNVKGLERVILAPKSYETSCVEIARRAFVCDRFHSDPLIDRERADDVKARWTQNSFHGRADACLVIPGETDIAVGFVLCMQEGENAVIDLIAVDSDHHGKGLGKALVAGALSHYKGRASAMRVGTQETNHASIKLYESMGFVLQEKMITYHWHGTGVSS